MNRETWEWIASESDGYNSVAGLECTFMNFGLMTMDESCDSDSCRDFAKKYTMRFTVSLRLKVKILEETVETMQYEMNALREEMRNQIDMMATVVSNAVDEVDSLRDKVEDYDFQSDIDSLGAEIDDLESRTSNLSDRLEIVEVVTEHTAEEVKDINSNLADRVLLE